MDLVNFITLTNNGYKSFTLNCLKSLENINFEKKLHCYTIGDNFHNELINKNYMSTLLVTDEISDSSYHPYMGTNWHSITKRKFEIIYKELHLNKYVCFTDGDIVFLKNNFMEYCLNNIKDNDLLIQNDSRKDSNLNNLCTGFMFIKSNDLTKNFFNPENVYKHIKPGIDDQRYVNSQINGKLKYNVLPLDLFPNGGHFTRTYHSTRSDSFDPLMIHFNCIKGGHRKIGAMKGYNKWYIDKNIKR